NLFDWVLVWFVARSQINWIHADFVRELVHRGFERECSGRFARRSHKGVGHNVEVHNFLAQVDVPGFVEMTRRKRKLLREIIVFGGASESGVDQGGEIAVSRGAKRDPLLGRRASAD